MHSTGMVVQVHGTELEYGAMSYARQPHRTRWYPILLRPPSYCHTVSCYTALSSYALLSCRSMLHAALSCAAYAPMPSVVLGCPGLEYAPM
eukprot:3940887-Rhodomonas_salina.1